MLAAAAGALLAVAGAGAQEVTPVYRQILTTWADGSRAQAARDLAAFEQRWVSELDTLQGFQALVLSQLVRHGDHLGLIAVARLHQEAFRLHQEALVGGAGSTHRDLLEHSMWLSDKAVKLSLEYSGSNPEIRRHAALLQTSMAVLLREYDYLKASSRRLLRATKLDPDLAVAFEWGGAAEELLSRLDSARKLLRRLIELEPDNGRGRLRLAVVEAKLGNPAARDLLEDIVDGGHRSWVWVVAAEELAQDYARAGRTDDAIALLRRALEEYPDEQGLSVALAFFDRGHRGRSRATLEALESRAAPASARVAYGQWEGREAFEVEVEALVVAHLPHLDEALFWTDPSTLWLRSQGG